MSNCHILVFEYPISFPEYLVDFQYYFYKDYRINIKGFFFHERKFSSIKNPSQSFDDVLLIIFAGMSSPAKRRIPWLLEFLSYLNGGTYLSVINCAFGKEYYSLVYDTIGILVIMDNMSILVTMDIMGIYGYCTR